MPNSFKHDESYVNRHTLIQAFVGIMALTALVSYSFYWNSQNIRNEKLKLALAEAKANWNKDASFRKWATLHGGLYVKPNQRTPPSPALAHLPDRDVITTSGQKLTLMNPAYMMRQMTEEFEQNYGIKGKITGKLQLNPINKPDDWQLKVLNLFETGETNEVYEQQIIEGKPYLRYMKAMYMTEGCVKCHGILGFKDGDLRGGVSVSIPLSPYFSAAEESNRSILATHATIWILGVLVIIILSRLINKLLSRMSYETLHDQLTNLPNITLFKNRLDQSFKKFRRDPDYLFTVGFLDLDSFKNLNDSRGHKLGDQLLVSFSQRLEKLLRPGDTVARMGGDEFTLLFDDLKNIEDAIYITERILSAIKEPFFINNEEIYTTASIGLSVITNAYTQSEDLIRDADIAMYRAKSKGKGQMAIFNKEMHDAALENMQIENDLRTALKKNQMEVYYQPVIDVKNNRIAGFEALLRWLHPEKGFIPPDRFIPVAENSGKIKELGLWVLEQSCHQTQKWNQQFANEQEFSISVNLSPIQLIDNDAHNTINRVIDAYHLNHQLLHLEITETALIEQKDKTKSELERIRNLGVSVSIDDFGKGYCSLTYLQEFEFDTLKIDKDFVQDMIVNEKSTNLVRMLMRLGLDLDLKVIAEGVETEEQLEQLIKMNCPYVQGYYFSPPLPAEKITQLLEKGCHNNADLLLNQ